jgi:hypothetical protein
MQRNGKSEGRMKVSIATIMNEYVVLTTLDKLKVSERVEIHHGMQDAPS